MLGIALKFFVATAAWCSGFVHHLQN